MLEKDINKGEEAMDILENELNDEKIKMNLLEKQKYNKLRLVQINTYYGKRFNAHSQLMKTIVFMCIPLIILSVLANKGILPANIYVFLSGLIIVIGLMLIILQLVDISNRDNMNWDEYNWYFDKSSAPTSNATTSASGETGSNNPWTTTSATCIGSSCCYEGSIYDEGLNICVPYGSIEETEETVETFGGLHKYGYTQTKPVYTNN